jgi:hypothetical protein
VIVGVQRLGHVELHRIEQPSDTLELNDRRLLARAHIRSYIVVDVRAGATERVAAGLAERQPVAGAGQGPIPGTEISGKSRTLYRSNSIYLSGQMLSNIAHYL